MVVDGFVLLFQLFFIIVNYSILVSEQYSVLLFWDPVLAGVLTNIHIMQNN